MARGDNLKGKKHPDSGRKKGVSNKINQSVKEVVGLVFNQLQGKPGVNLHDWALDNTTEFYKIAAKLIPTDLNATVQHKGLADVLGTIGQSARTSPPVEETGPDAVCH